MNVSRRRKTTSARACIEARKEMESFCSRDFRGKDAPQVPWDKTKQALFDARLAAMSLQELTQEYNRRDGDHVLEHGCPPEILELNQDKGNGEEV
jgi:hypothetical protein